MEEKQLKLTNFVNSIINELENIKNELEKEIIGEYFNLYCIAYRLEMYSASGISHRRGRLDTDSDNSLSL